MEQFFRIKNLNMSAKCLRQLMKNLDVELVVENIHRKKLINKHKKLNKQLYNVNEAVARNPNNIKHDVQLETFFVTDAMEAYSINISKVNGLMGKFQFPSIQNLEISLQFFGSDRFIHSIEKPFRLVTQPFKIKMDPLSSNRVKFNYYTYDNVYNYEVDFELRNTSTIRFLHNEQDQCLSELSPRLSLNVLGFFEENPNIIESINHNNEQQIKFEYVNGKYILKGFPLIEKLSCAEVRTVISDKDDL